MNVVTPPPLPPVIDNYAPTERIFTNSGIGGGEGPRDSGDPTEYEALVRDMIDDAQSFEDSTLAPARDENLQYFYAEEPAPEGEGTSTAVSTDFRDTVMAIIPSLIRIFTSPEHVVNCHPNYEGQEEAAKQCTDYLQYMFMEDNPGFLILHDIMKDALRCKIGVVKWWTDIDEEVTEQTYRNITRDQLQALIFENPTVEIIDLQENMEIPSAPPSLEMPPNISSGPDIPEQIPFEAGGMLQQSMLGHNGGPPLDEEPTIEEVTIRFVKSKPITKIESVPLDEFRIDRRAKSVESAQLIGHDQIVNMGDLIAAGYTREEVEPHVGATSTYSVDRSYRNPGIDEANISEDQNVRYGCYFIRIDRDGDGIPELRKIETISDQHIILRDDVVQHANFSVWSPDPEPHTLVGDSPAELVKDIQVIKTNMLRGSLDSLAQSIWPRTVFNETLVDADDVLNDEIGAAIRTRGDPASTVMSIAHQFVGQPVFDMFAVMETLRQQRTGISDASKGVDPKALQSTALQGVDAIVTGAQERIELCARILAETGLKPLFKGLLRECVNNPNQERTIQLRGKWTKIDPSTFDPSMRISVNPTLGKGSDMTRLLVLQDIKATQTAIMEQFGVDNPLCGPVEYRNTISDMLAIGNIKNVDRYFKQLDQATLDQIAQTPKEPDPATILAQAEMEKTRGKMATEIANQDFQNKKLKADDDFRRDQLNVKSMLDARKMEAEYGAQVDEQALEAMNLANEAASIENDRQSVMNEQSSIQNDSLSVANDAVANENAARETTNADN